MPLTPNYAAAVADVARGSTGSLLRPDRVPGLSLTAYGGGSLENWFKQERLCDAPRMFMETVLALLSIPGPGTVSVDGSLSKTITLRGNTYL